MTIQTNRLGAAQGDVILRRVDALPADARRTAHRVVASGETTGHRHEVRGCEVAYESPAGWFFAPAANERAELAHVGLDDALTGEHATIEMAPGMIWFAPRISQVEYDGENERRVMD